MTCASNWTKKSCCSDFECNLYCNTTRCRTDTCGQTKCSKIAANFTTGVPISGPQQPQRDAFGNIVNTPPNIIVPNNNVCKFPTSGASWIPSEELELAEYFAEF